mmetsp:Transcript_33032/g.37906  ORF Transcript_33032/g.37906 Transcript_33032/m.37906 type:complete len:201 (+) Transcript_33032:759-1361(+)
MQAGTQGLRREHRAGLPIRHLQTAGVSLQLEPDERGGPAQTRIRLRQPGRILREVLAVVQEQAEKRLRRRGQVHEQRAGEGRDEHPCELLLEGVLEHQLRDVGEGYPMDLSHPEGPVPDDALQRGHRRRGPDHRHGRLDGRPRLAGHEEVHRVDGGQVHDRRGHAVKRQPGLDHNSRMRPYGPAVEETACVHGDQQVAGQ